MSNHSSLRIGVVFGGASGEHDVSIRSALTVIKALDATANNNHFETVPIYIDRDGRWWDPTVAQRALDQTRALDANDLPQPLPAPGLRHWPVDPDTVELW